MDLHIIATELCSLNIVSKKVAEISESVAYYAWLVYKWCFLPGWFLQVVSHFVTISWLWLKREWTVCPTGAWAVTQLWLFHSSLFPGPSNVTAGIENIQGNIGPFDILHSGKKVRKAGQEKENLPPHILSCSFVSRGSPLNQRASCLKHGTLDVHSVLLYSCPSQTNPGSIDKQCINDIWSCNHAIASDGGCTDHCVHSSYCLWVYGLTYSPWPSSPSSSLHSLFLFWA